MKSPKFHKYDRAGHEAEAIRILDTLRRGFGYNSNYGYSSDCSPKGLRSLSRSAGLVAQARTHIVSIGSSDRSSKRTRVIWGRIAKAEKQLRHQEGQILKSCKVDGVSLAGLGRARRAPKKRRR